MHKSHNAQNHMHQNRTTEPFPFSTTNETQFWIFFFNYIDDVVVVDDGDDDDDDVSHKIVSAIE